MARQAEHLPKVIRHVAGAADALADGLEAMLGLVPRYLGIGFLGALQRIWRQAFAKPLHERIGARHSARREVLAALHSRPALGELFGLSAVALGDAGFSVEFAANFLRDLRGSRRENAIPEATIAEFEHRLFELVFRQLSKRLSVGNNL
ncbi:hypothetical protein C5689_06405 [Methylosinus sporium]|uniref:Uncharacterized protein n=1 Tax=Methylosinus sporium TaxID=428 RepID=A0A2U1SSW7_METSR|nr:hypothetical protein C5689_06405 [Methylosinus sporium]